jgi:hypothetical protein
MELWHGARMVHGGGLGGVLKFIENVWRTGCLGQLCYSYCYATLGCTDSTTEHGIHDNMRDKPYRLTTFTAMPTPKGWTSTTLRIFSRGLARRRDRHDAS